MEKRECEGRNFLRPHQFSFPIFHRAWLDDPNVLIDIYTLLTRRVINYNFRTVNHFLQRLRKSIYTHINQEKMQAAMQADIDQYIILYCGYLFMKSL